MTANQTTKKICSITLSRFSFRFSKLLLLSGGDKRPKDFSEGRFKVLEPDLFSDTLARGDDPGEL